MTVVRRRQSDARLFRRLLLVASIASLPLFVVSLALIAGSSRNSVGFTSQEKRGVALHLKLSQVLDEVYRFESASRHAAATAADDRGLVELSRKIDASVASLARDIRGRVGLALGFSDDNLRLHKRDLARIAVLETAWSEVRKLPTGSAESQAATRNVLASISEMMAHNGDSSNLVLDNSLDSFYLVDLSVYTLPRTRRHVAEAGATFGRLPGDLPPIARQREAARLSALLKTEDVARAARDVDTALREDANFDRVSVSLQENLPPATTKFSAAAATFIALLDRMAAGETIAPSDWESAAVNLATQTQILTDVSANELTRLLDQRQDAIRQRRLVYYTLVSLTMSLAVVALGFIIRALLRARAVESDEMEKKLRTSAEKFSKAFEANPSPISIVDAATGRYLDVNESATRLWGYSKAELVGRTAMELGIWRDPAAREDFRRPLKATGSIRNFEATGYTRSGEVRTVLMNAEQVTLDDQPCIISLLHDITEQKRSQALLREKHDQLVVAMDIARLAHWELDLATNIVTTDGALFHLIGTSFAPENQVRLPLQDYIAKFVHADDGALVAREIARGATNPNDKFAWQFEHRVVRADGSEGVMLVRARLASSATSGQGRVLGTNEDITEQKRAQAEMVWKTAFHEAQIHSAIDGVLVVDDRGRKIQQNRSLLELFKVPAEVAEDDEASFFEFLIGQTTDPKKFQARVTHFDTHRDEVGRDEFQLPDGRFLDVSSAPVFDRVKKFYGRIWTFRDITEQRSIEEQYRQAQKMEAIGTLAGGIAHDFNNILAGILGYVELSKRLVPNEPVVNRFLDLAMQGGDRAVSLVKQILAFSRQQEQQRSPIQLRHIVAEPIELLRASIPSTIEIDFVFGAELPAVLADATQIHQVVMNLCTNAAHAMRDQAGRLSVRVENFLVDFVQAKAQPELRPGPYVRISVSDTGHGMSEETKARIFEPFFTTKGPGEGTGLGLAVVHGIMKSHDGAITVYSQLGEGTVFHLYFPAIAEAALDPEKRLKEIPLGQGQRVLFVDDEKSLALLGGHMLEELGYTVESFTSVVEALARFREDPARFDAVITDLTMPVMRGTEFARQLLLIRPSLPVILTTGYTASLTDQRLRELGIFELMLKPHSLLVFGETLQRALARR